MRTQAQQPLPSTHPRPIGYLVDSPGWRGRVVNFDWAGYRALGNRPVIGGEQSAMSKVMVEESRRRRERQASELLRRRNLSRRNDQ